MHLHLGWYAVLGEYIGIDVDPLGGADMLAWFCGEQCRNPGKLDSVKVSVHTCDMEKLSLGKLYAILRAARSPMHIYIGGPPCMPGFWPPEPQRYGLWGEFSRLYSQGSLLHHAAPAAAVQALEHTSHVSHARSSEAMQSSVMHC